MTTEKRLPLDPQALHPYSRRLYEFLRLHRPDWLRHGFNVPGRWHDGFNLEIELPPVYEAEPVGVIRRRSEPLTFWMDDDEDLSLTYWYWHTHASLGAALDRPPESDYRAILELADGILADRQVVISRFAGGRWAGSCLVSADDLDEELATMPEEAGVDEVVVRSWSGRLNRRR